MEATLQKVDENGVSIVVVTLLGREFKFVNRCSHFGCDLSKGKVEGSSIICICGWQYDLLTGRALNQPLARLDPVD